MRARAVTLLFTDIEGSTQLLHRLGDEYAQLLADHRTILRAAFAENGGREVDNQGDAFFVAFPTPRGALAAAATGQVRLAAHRWPGDAAVRVRMGVHTGEPLATDEGFVGIDVHRAARICSAAHGGQVAVSAETASAVQRSGDPVVVLRELGLHTLKDLPEPELLFQVVVDGLPADFPPLRVHAPPASVSRLADYSQPPADVPCPYKGLLAFEAQDDALFCGREDLVARLLERLEAHPFLCVVGASGSGKSSVVRAGLIPQLKTRGGGAAILFTPGADPLQALASALADASEGSPATIRNHLEHATTGLDEVLSRIGTPGRRVTVVVDQFEELFTLCADEHERGWFIDVLMRAGRTGGVACVVIVLRADFYGACTGYPALG